ncbi:hypothetical protein [Streptomyces neyagawaensis]|uniref:EamA domain-containing protein n=1 Tax=Streptomyces neyagawaensis TaxID=42238 RepID=A0ABV3BA39_9ACTN
MAAELYDVGGIGPFSVSFWRFLTALGLLLAAHLVRRSRRPETALSLRAAFAANPRRALITGPGWRCIRRPTSPRFSRPG